MLKTWKFYQPEFQVATAPLILAPAGGLWGSTKWAIGILIIVNPFFKLKYILNFNSISSIYWVFYQTVNIWTIQILWEFNILIKIITIQDWAYAWYTIKYCPKWLFLPGLFMVKDLHALHSKRQKDKKTKWQQGKKAKRQKDKQTKRQNYPHSIN